MQSTVSNRELPDVDATHTTLASRFVGMSFQYGDTASRTVPP
ncbi:MAG: hypothetical protein ACKPCM_04205 [Pseudanabaena sp.]